MSRSSEIDRDDAPGGYPDARLARLGVTDRPVLSIDDLTLALPDGGDRAYAIRNLSLTVASAAGRSP